MDYPVLMIKDNKVNAKKNGLYDYVYNKEFTFSDLKYVNKYTLVNIKDLNIRTISTTSYTI